MQGDILIFNPVLISAVHFSATIPGYDQHNLPAGRTLVFDHVYANKGGGYNTNNGVFTSAYFWCLCIFMDDCVFTRLLC